MATLEQLIAHMYPDEISEFHNFTNRMDGDTMELKLVDLLASKREYSRAELMAKFYKVPNRNAVR